MRLDTKTHDALAEQFNRDGMVLLRNHFPPDTLRAWRDAFQPLLDAHVEMQKDSPNRGTNRYYVTLPFTGVFADPTIFEDDDVLAIVERVAGAQPVMCQLATDTPLRGSDYQGWHRDTPPLFEEWGRETPAFQLAVNFPLCDVTEANGALETTLGTHLIPREAAMEGIASGDFPVERVPMQLGDVMIRDVRQLHRGTPNHTDAPRPMVVIGYSRRWLYRPEVHIRVPQSVHDTLSPRARELLRFNPVVPDAELVVGEEHYRQFAY